ncbi:DEAD/DEAH box helicase [Clostridium botulinum]|uniref:Uncharacterized protein n=1 Tax=Clostridium botulinum TaxID=1491 RepID=A0A6B4JL21_CLOBO|nr:DEAD/DEAH box helicase family protein [Clostridium botulinum]MBY6760112.1 DEAD/DEAH box helicase family protein [Clostridium botulinum]MBY6919021.1 DEAD/DEAH box helicase family protein [Clostridium botulinum]NFJ57335.1 hypothetical protein [Clostridium botulinum]NFL52369.1 hypothetical protein [Clostridium botulinum]NFN80589.1 hypothetical protein [Clostridium botulinum]
MSNLCSKCKYKIIKGISSNIKITDERSIFIVTIQALLSIKKQREHLYNKLKDNINLIIFDEGHREPSLKWRNIIEEFEKKTILFTATPYRNDKLGFKIASRYSYYLSYGKALKQRYIKDVQFEAIDNRIINDEEAFAKYICNLHSDNEKIIIRSDNSQDIASIVNNINNLCINDGLKRGIAVGIHSSFKNEDYFKKNYSEILKKEFSIFVHQNKMVEGINIPEINKLFFHQTFKNSRSIVQQIGRAIRKLDNNDNLATIYLPEEEKKIYEEQWQLFIEYDEKSGREDNKTGYFNNRFIRKFDLHNKDFFKQIYVPKSAVIYHIDSKDIKFKKIVNLIRDKIINQIHVVDYNEKIFEKRDMWLMCYKKEKNADILLNEIFVETTLECAVLVKEENMIFYYDSSGFSLPVHELETAVDLVNSNEIIKLLNENCDFNSVKLNNIILSEFGIRENNLVGKSIQNVNSSLTESLVTCTNVSANVESRVKRDINVYSSKVKDNEKCSFEEYMQWVKAISKEILTNNTNSYFKRFAKIVNSAETGDVSSILLNLSELDDNLYKIIRSNGEYEKISDFSSCFTEVCNDSFKFNIGSDSIEGVLKIYTYRKMKKIRVELTNNNYYIDNDGSMVSLVNYLNNENKFTVMFKTGIVYMGGNLLNPNTIYKEIDLEDTSIGKIMYPISELESCENEKSGKKVNVNIINCWPNDSIFGVLINLIKSKDKRLYDGEIDYLVCDDLDKEIADFIAIDTTKNKVILIHCKHSGKGVSASTYQDACGQAKKNLAYVIRNTIDSLEDKVQLHINRWNNNPWVDKDKKIEVSRIMTDKITGEDFWEKYKEILTNINSTVEVWIFGNLTSYGKLKTQLKNSNPEEQVNQLMWLLNSTNETISQVGAKLRIFCMP